MRSIATIATIALLIVACASSAQAQALAAMQGLGLDVSTQCTDLFNSHVSANSDLATCIAGSFGTDATNVRTGTAMNFNYVNACASDCLEDGLRVASRIHEANASCITSMSALAGYLDNLDFMNIVCAQPANNLVCGTIYANLNTAYGESGLTENADICNAFQMHGACLATFQTYLVASGTRTTAVATTAQNAIIMGCEGLDPSINVTSNFEGSVSPANLSSGSVATSLISVLVAAVAAFFVMN